LPIKNTQSWYPTFHQTFHGPLLLTQKRRQKMLAWGVADCGAQQIKESIEGLPQSGYVQAGGGQNGKRDFRIAGGYTETYADGNLALSSCVCGSSFLVGKTDLQPPFFFLLI
jgi:small ligand-binding sensory domain FIST